MDADFIKYLATLGVGGTLACMMFFVYRKDMRQVLDAWKGQSELLLSVVKENTAAISTLTSLIKELISREQ